MSLATLPAPAAPVVPAAAPAALAAPSPARLFRASLAEGRLHPLYLPLLGYRAAQAGTAG